MTRVDNPHDWAPSGRQRVTADPARLVSTKAALLRALHRPGEPLTLPNAWDAASGRAVVRGGFPVVATSSSAVAESLGYADGEGAPIEEMLDAVARIVRAVEVPVTADLERGYGARPQELVERLVATGAAGCNLEDSDPRTGRMIEPERQADFLAAVRDVAASGGLDLVINARIDSYLRAGPDRSGVLDDATARARRYLAAGADCVFPLLAPDRDHLKALFAVTDGRLNVLFRGGPHALSLPELAQSGVSRISFGGSLHRAGLEEFRARLSIIGAGGDPLA